MYDFTVPAMHCGGCAKTITRIVGELDAKAKVDIDLDSKRVSVETTRSREAVAARLVEAGFEPA
jgi:copper chaperone